MRASPPFALRRRRFTFWASGLQAERTILGATNPAQTRLFPRRKILFPYPINAGRAKSAPLNKTANRNRSKRGVRLAGDEGFKRGIPIFMRVAHHRKSQLSPPLRNSETRGGAPSCLSRDLCGRGRFPTSYAEPSRTRQASAPDMLSARNSRRAHRELKPALLPARLRLPISRPISPAQPRSPLRFLRLLFPSQTLH